MHSGIILSCGYQNQRKSCFLPDITCLLLSLLLISANAVSSDCYDCEINYFKCRAMVTKNAQREDGCQCVLSLHQCYANSTCKDETNIVKTDCDYLRCSCPSEVYEKKSGLDKTSSSVYVGGIVFGSIAVWAVICFAVFVTKRANTKIEEVPAPTQIIIPSKLESSTEDAHMCHTCKKNETDCIFYPCGHKYCCYDCGKRLKECPACGAKVDSIIKVFDA